MKLKFLFAPFFTILAACMISSCQKEIDGLINGSGVNIPVNQKPKLGTTWTYRYSTFYSFGGLFSSKMVTLKAKTEEILGGETWLNIVDMDADTTVYLLNTKTDGLYQYTNGNSYLFCKYPAALNETYNTYNKGEIEDFTVKGVNDSISTAIGRVPVNYYEGIKNGLLIDLVWYNDNAWIVWHVVWRKVSPPGTAYYRYSTMYIDNIIY